MTAMLNRIHYFKIIIFFGIFSCSNSSDKIYSELENFDNSLDSLITEETTHNPRYCILLRDTLKNSPKQIEESYYEKIDNDSIRIEANCHIYQFENNELVLNSSYNGLGQKYVKNYIFFKNIIDNKLIDSLRNNNHNSDTIFFGCLKRYTADGKLVKSITSGVWIEIDHLGRKIIKDNRMLEVYAYSQDGKYYTTHRKEYFNKKYNVDSLKTIKVKQFKTDLSPKDKNTFQYLYTYDKYGNWIIKRRINSEYPEVYYRNILY